MSIFCRRLLLGVLIIPLQSETGWHHLRYGGVATNKVNFGPSGLSIQVERSASPLVYPLPPKTKVTTLDMDGLVLGFPHIPANREEGSGSHDDFALRVGLALEGERSLGWLEKLLAPKWLRRLAEISPDSRFGKVSFLAISQQKEKGWRREHPRARHVEEEVALKLTAPGSFVIHHEYPEPVETFGVWVQSDGDDTKSSFQVVVRSLVLHTED